MIGRSAPTSRSSSVGPLLLAFGAAIPLATLSGHVTPLHAVSNLEIGNDFVALLGLAWAVIQGLTHRHSQTLRRAWMSAAVGALLIVGEDHIEPLLAFASPTIVEPVASIAIWIVSGLLMLSCGRRYGMRRYVMVAMRLGFAASTLAVALITLAESAGLAETHPWIGRVEDFAELAATVLFVSGLVLTQVSPVKSYRFPANEVGRRARRLFYDFNLETRLRYPAPYAIFALPGFRHALTLAIILRYLPVAARAVRLSSGRTTFGQLLDLLRVGFAHGIDAKSYYVHDLYRPIAGLVDETMTRVETKNGFNRAIQDLRSGHAGPRNLNDKFAFWRVCEENDIVSAPILATVEAGVIAWLSGADALDRDLFVKERAGRGGAFTLNFERTGRFLYRDDDGSIVNLEEMRQRLCEMSATRNLMIQPKLKNHPSIASLADQSLIVFRVMTCLDHRGEPKVTHGVLRLLRRFEPNWPTTADADWGCAIDIETGELGLMTGDAPETCTRWFADHPVTGERVTGTLLEGWGEIAEVAVAAHGVFSARVLIGWDIGWTPEGPVILEGNSNTDFSYFQRVSRTPVGRSPLGPLLNAHFDVMTARLLEETAAAR